MIVGGFILRNKEEIMSELFWYDLTFVAVMLLVNIGLSYF